LRNRYTSSTRHEDKEQVSMSLWNRIDKESKGPLEALWEALPGGLNGIPDIVTRRAAMSASRAAAPKADFPNLDVTEQTYAGPAGDLTLRLYQAKSAPSKGQGLIYIHGGGMIMGDLDSQDENMREAATSLDMPIASIDYRKAPEHPYPATQVSAGYLSTQPNWAWTKTTLD
jgi:acetyl esterase/lipase